MGSFGTTEIILVVAVLFLLFGASRLPQLAKSIGQSKKAFKEGLKDAEAEDDNLTPNVDRASAGAAAPQITAMSDDALEAEMRKRAEARAEH